MAWWSWSTFSRIAPSGARLSSERSLSSASATNQGPVAPHARPCRAPPAMVAPTQAEASPRAACSIALVVDLPWAPATARPRRPAISSASSSERCSTGRPAAARLDQLGVVGGDRGRDDEGRGVGRAGRRRRVPGARVDARRPAGRRASATSSRSVPRHAVAGRPGQQGEPAHARAADPHHVDGPGPGLRRAAHPRRRRRGRGSAAAAAARDRRATSSATRVGGVRAAHRARRLGHRLEAAAVGQQRARPGPQALAGAVGVGQHHRGPGLGQPPGVLGLVVARWPAGRAPGSTGGRWRRARTPSRPSGRPPGRRPRSPRAGCRASRAGGSAARAACASSSAPRLVHLARPGDVDHVERRVVAEGLDGGQVERARALAAAHHQDDGGASGAMPKARRPGRARGLGDGAAHRAAGDQVLGAGAAGAAGRPASPGGRAARPGGWRRPGASRPRSAAAGRRVSQAASATGPGHVAAAADHDVGVGGARAARPPAAWPRAASTTVQRLRSESRRDEARAGGSGPRA